MAKETISKLVCADMLLLFVQDTVTHRVGFAMMPSAAEGGDKSEKKTFSIDSLVQVKFEKDPYPTCYAQGQSMRNSKSADRFVFDGQTCEESNGETVIRTRLVDMLGHAVTNVITHPAGGPYILMYNVFENLADEPVTLEMFESFELGGISPYEPGDAPGTLLLHRLRSKWSHEGRLVTDRIEDLQLEPSWSGQSVSAERFGAVGSMPVMKYFPFAAVEDEAARVLWGVKLMTESSWQIQAYRRDDCLHLSGGLADREFGQWEKKILPGASFATPTAILSVCRGDLDTLCHRLLCAAEPYTDAGPACEEELPIIFNEYCTSWGHPCEEEIFALLSALKGHGISYFVIDAGWYKQPGIPWDKGMGDYLVSKSQFPSGMENTVSAIREAGMQPGIWFEIDNIGEAAEAYTKEEAHMLCRDGVPLTTDSRRFWNMSDPWVIKYLTDRVIGMLKKYGFSYLKMDYNDSIGIGCDGEESLGEALRQDREASLSFVRKIKEEIPGIILENCASGGHRLEPLMMSECAMASFSDAHETPEIPIIALNLHRVILPRQSQIWAVIRKDDSLKRVGYSVANTFLGRMCLSGDMTQLSDAQWDVIDRGIAYYRTISPIIAHGFSHRFGPKILSDRHPIGYQALLRVGEGKEGYVLIHVFGGELPPVIEIPLLDCAQTVDGTFSYDGKEEISIAGGRLRYFPRENMTAVSIHLRDPAQS